MSLVLEVLGKKLTSAISSLSANSPIDEPALDNTLKSICAALLESDVNVKLVKGLRERVKVRVLPQLKELEARGGQDMLVGNKGKQAIQKAVYDELVGLVDPGEKAKPPLNPVKGKTSVIMMVGLQGAGKTTTCTKLATHYMRRGLKTALVCADTFRAGAFDQLKQNAAKAKVPFFGSYTETDPVAIAASGVAKFRADRFDVIIVDTSGRHRQESELFEEMVQIGAAVKPDMSILVLDGAIGQAAEAQSRAFKDASDFGAIIVTKLDGHAKGGGAISAVAATQTPIVFIGTGEHLHDLEKFNPTSFISKMLGMGDMTGLMEHAQEMALADPGRQEKMMAKLEKGEFTIRDLKEQLATIMGMGPLSKLTSMIPGMGGLLGEGGEEQAGNRMKRFAFIFDAMTTAELDSDGSIFRDPVASTSKAVSDPNGKAKAEEDEDMRPREPNKRVLRVARGSGTSVNEVEELLAQHQMFSGLVKGAGGKSGWMSKMKGMAGGAGGRPGAGGMPGMGGMPGLGGLGGLGGGMPDLGALSKMMPPGMMEQMRQPGAMQQMQEMMKSMGAGGGGFPGMGGGGMPDLGALSKMFGGGR